MNKKQLIKVTANMTKEDVEIFTRLAAIWKINKTDAIRRAIRLAELFVDINIKGNKMCVTNRYGEVTGVISID